MDRAIWWVQTSMVVDHLKWQFVVRFFSALLRWEDLWRSHWRSLECFCFNQNVNYSEFLKSDLKLSLWASLAAPQFYSHQVYIKRPRQGFHWHKVHQTIMYSELRGISSRRGLVQKFLGKISLTVYQSCKATLLVQSAMEIISIS